MRALEQPIVAVATLDGRSYYAITRLLRHLHIKYVEYDPRHLPKEGIKLVLTSSSERALVKHPSVLCIEELVGEPWMVKGRIYEKLYGEPLELLVGVDTGKRIALVVRAHGVELGSALVDDEEEAVILILRLFKEMRAKRQVVRIGDGNLKQAMALARALLLRRPQRLEVELVNEEGTSSLVRARPNRRGSRDLASARAIALRPGKMLTADPLS